MIEALKDKEADIRRSAAYGLGSFQEQGKSAVVALQESLQDPDAGVRKAAGIALSHIEPKGSRVRDQESGTSPAAP